MNRSGWSRAACALLLGVAMAGTAPAVTLSASGVNLADAVAGQDLWRIDYTLGGALQADHGVTLFYPTNVFSALDLVVAPSADWSTSLSPGDSVAGFEGLLSLSALHDLAASQSTTFSLEFVRLAGPALAPQIYEVFDDGFTPVGGGQFPIAVNAVPEPGTWHLLAAGALALLWVRRRGRRAAAAPFAVPAAA